MKGFFKAKAIEPLPPAVVCNRAADVGDHVFGEVIDVHPGELVTFVRLCIEDFSLPLTRYQVEVDAILAGLSVHNAYDVHVLGSDFNPALLLTLANGCGTTSSFFSTWPAGTL